MNNILFCLHLSTLKLRFYFLMSISLFYINQYHGSFILNVILDYLYTIDYHLILFILIPTHHYCSQSLDFIIFILIITPL